MSAQLPLDAILVDLDDDAPRRVLADQLEAAGDPRGELISVQCELARIGYASRPPTWDWVGDALIDPEEVDASHVRKLRVRENALLKAHGARWLDGLAGVELARGFPASVRFDAFSKQPRERFEALIAAAPTIETLELSSGPSGNAALDFFQSPALARIRELRVGSQAVLGLTRGATLGALRRLSLHGDQEILRALVAWSGLARLSKLELNPVGIGAEGLASLLAACAPLEELQLRSAGIGVAGAAALAAEPKLAGVRVLALLNNKLGEEGVRALAASPHLAGLRALDLRKNKIGVAGAAALGGAFPALRTLDLTGNTLGRAGVEALGAGGGLGKLRELCLQQTGLDDDALEALAASPLLGHVRILSLRSNKIGDRGALALARSPHGGSLEQVNLNNNALGDKGKKALAASDALPHARIVCR